MAFIDFDIVGQKLNNERLIRVLETVNADVVGGSVKDVSTGHWGRGCYQTEHVMYTLKYTNGYQRSFHECLFCDHVTSPFVAKTSFMKSFKFPNDNHGLYRDLFYKLKRSGKTSLSCPDVKIYIAPLTESDSDLEKFGERWDVGQIVEAINNVKRKLLYFRDGPLDKRSFTSARNRPFRPFLAFYMYE